jgi:hypothetical protein
MDPIHIQKDSIQYFDVQLLLTYVTAWIFSKSEHCLRFIHHESL